MWESAEKLDLQNLHLEWDEMKGALEMEERTQYMVEKKSIVCALAALDVKLK